MNTVDDAGIAEPDSQEVTRQLAAVLGSPRFRRSPNLQRLLKFVVEETQHGGSGLRDATSIGRGALGKDSNFASSRDASVRVAMNRLRTALDLYYANEGIGDDVVIRMIAGCNRPTFAFRSQDQVPDAATHALYLAKVYQERLTREAHRHALQALQSTLKIRPNDPTLLSAYIDICLDSFKYQYDSVTHPLDEAYRIYERTESIAPDMPEVLLQRGMIALVDDDLTMVSACGQKLISTDSNDAAANMMGAWLLTITLDPIHAAKELNLDPSATDLPSWMHLARYLATYRKADYEAALDAAIAFGLPNFFWGPALRAAALAQLGLQDAAKRQLSLAIACNPQFVTNPRWHFGHHIKHTDMLEHVLEGLGKAGL